MRRATCSCGALSIETRGEPARVLICSCTQCQKRTGSVYGVSAYFREADIASRTGAASVFTRKGESGKTLTFNFCPVCGSSLHWTAELLPGLVGVACGAFEAGDALPDPDGAFWLQHKADWVPMPDDILGHPTTPSRAQGVGTAPAAAGGEAAQAGE